MKKIITVCLLSVILCLSLTGCGEKDYKFTQEDWDTNDLSFIETTADPNQAYKFVGYFAKNYEGYVVNYYPAEEHHSGRDCIQIGVPYFDSYATFEYIDRYTIFEYYIIDSEYGARNFFKRTTDKLVYEEEANYGDESYVQVNEEAGSFRYFVREGNCVLIIRSFYADSDIEKAVKKFLRYMY